MSTDTTCYRCKFCKISPIASKIDGIDILMAYCTRLEPEGNEIVDPWNTNCASFEAADGKKG